MKSTIRIAAILIFICIKINAQTISNACSDASGQQIVVGNVTASQNVSDGTVNDPTPTTCATSPSKDGWFWFDATSSSTTIVFNNSSNKDAVLYGYSGSCGSLTYLNCADASGTSGHESMVLSTTSGTRYRIRVARYSGTGGTLTGTLGIYNNAPDSCGAAITLTQASTSSPVSYSIGNATQSLSPLTCTNYLSSCANDVWFKFVAASSNPTVVVTGGATFDAVLDIRSGSCNGTSISCVDATVGGEAETINCSGLTIGTTYYIRVYAWMPSGTGYPSTKNFTITVYGICTTPTAYNVTGGGTVCQGGSGVTVGLSNSTSGCSYQLLLNGSNSGSPVAGTGSSISFGTQTSLGTYTVVATSGACTAAMTGIASIQCEYYRSKTSGNWASASTWEVSNNNSIWSNASSAPTSSANSITILNGHSVYATANVSSNNLTVAGTYEHRLNGGTIPTATWSSGSTCLISGAAGATLPLGLNQTFYNLTWNWTTQNGSVSTAAALTNISGLLNIVSTGTGNLNIVASGSNPSCVYGSLKIDGGTFYLSGGTSDPVVTINGNVTINGGTFQPAQSTGAPTINVSGNWIKSAGTFTHNYGTVNFNGTSAQSVSGINTFNNLSLDNSQGLTISANTTVTGVLTLTNGKITTGSYELILTNTSTSSIAGHSSSKYIIGKLRRSVSTTGSYDFPLGTASDYQLITISFTSALGFSNILGTFTSGNPAPSGLPSGLISNGKTFGTMLNNGYWSLTPNATMTAGVYSVSLNAKGYTNSLTSDPSDYIVVKRHDGSSSWGISGTPNLLGQLVSNGIITTISTGLTSFSDYGAGVNCSGVVSSAGSDQTICGTSTTLAGNAPSSGTGTWSILSGTGGSISNPTSPNSGFSGSAGTTYSLKWNVTNGTCPSASDTVLISFSSNPTTSNAGSDQTVCGTSATLSGNNPTTGTGIWSIVNGTGGTLANASQRNTTFTGSSGNSYTLVWTISNSVCTASTDTVNIACTQSPTTASAGSDQNVCALTTTLTGNTPLTGTGTWSIVSGSGGTISNPSDPASTFSGVAGVNYILRWTVSNTPCAASTDDVLIKFYNEVTATAGSDQSVCGSTAVQLGGSIGGGAASATWTTNRNGTFSPNASTLNAIYTPGSSDVSNGSATITMTTNDPSGPCGSANSSLTITVGSTATASAGSDQEICSTSPATLNGSMGGAASSITWTTSGDGTFSDANSVTTTYTPGANDIINGLATLTITTDDPQGSCSAATDNMTLRVRSTAPAQPDSITGAPISVCPPSNGVVLQTNNDPNATSYSWFLAPGNNGITFLPVSTSNSQTINIGTTSNSGYVVRVTATNACGVSDYRSVFIRKTVGVPVSVTGDLVACGGTTKTYTSSSVTGATAYRWTGIAGMTFNGGAGPYSSPDTTVTVGFPTGFNTGTVCVAAQVACYTSTTKCITVAKTSPALNMLAGSATACPGAIETYTVPATAGASVYNWTLPANTYGSSSTNTISVTIGPNFSSGNLCVTATSICGVNTAPKCKSLVTGVPAKPATLTGALFSACGRAVDYTVPAVTGLTYAWTVPSGATINGASNGNTINVSMPSNFSTGSICASAVNSCGTSLSKCITVKGIPAQPAALTSNTAPVCAYSTGVVFSTDPASIALGDNLLWTNPTGTTLVSGQGTPSAIIDWGSVNGTVTLKASNTCGFNTRTLPVTIGCLRTAPGQGNNSGTAPKNNSTETNATVTTSENAINLQAYPDAEQKSMTFTFFAPSAGNYTYGLYDESNRLILNGNIDAVEGVNMQELDMSYMSPNAIYTLKVNNGTEESHINVRIK